MKCSLRQFNPDMVANLETKMWQAYYSHRFLRLFVLLVKLARSQFHFGYVKALRAAYYAAFAAALFRIQRGRENNEAILKKIISFYKIVESNSMETFDYTEAARLELQWWLVDRYPDRFSTTREEAMAGAMALLYKVSPDRLKDYAKYRAEGEVLKDEAEAQKKEMDWQQVSLLLRRSYRSLYVTVNNLHP